MRTWVFPLRRPCSFSSLKAPKGSMSTFAWDARHLSKSSWPPESHSHSIRYYRTCLPICPPAQSFLLSRPKTCLAREVDLSVVHFGGPWRFSWWLQIILLVFVRYNTSAWITFGGLRVLIYWREPNSEAHIWAFRFSVSYGEGFMHEFAGIFQQQSRASWVLSFFIGQFFID